MFNRVSLKKLAIIGSVIAFAVFVMVRASADRICEPGQAAEGEQETCVLLKAEMPPVWSGELDILRQHIRDVLREAGVRKRSRPVADGFSVSVRIPVHVEASLGYVALQERFSGKDYELTRSNDGATFKLTMTRKNRDTITESVMQRSLSVLPHRLDRTYTFGVEAARVGKYCILLHAPDFERSSAKYHSSAGYVSFHGIIAEVSNPHSKQAVTGKIVADARQGGRFWAVSRQYVFYGSDIDYARYKTEFWSREPIVTFRFQSTRHKRFANNDWFLEGKRYAVLLNGKVIAISPLKDLPLNGREGRIRGFSTVADAKTVAALMNLGGLSARFINVSDKKECAET